MPGKMIFIGSFYRLCDEEYIARSFESLGWTVKRFEASLTHNQQVLDEINTEQYSFLLTVNREIQGGFQSILGKIKTVFWLFDIFFGTLREPYIHLNSRFKCNYVFSTDGGHDFEFKKTGINHHVLRQGIWLEDAYVGQPRPEFKSDVCFVGTLHPYFHPGRAELLNFLQSNYDFKWWGQTSPNEIRGKRLNDLYASVKIIVGDSYPSPYYWSNRVYEVIGRGGFLLHPEIQGLEKEFKYYKHLIPFKFGDFNDLRKKIDYYLEYEEKREKIRQAGFEYCKKIHNFEKRCKILLKIIGES